MKILIDRVSKVYGQQKALDQVSFQLQTGEIVGLIGPNGAGKSTLMKIMTGYLPPTDGTVWYDQLQIIDNDLEIKKIVGYLPENNPLYLNMYVTEYLQLVAGFYHLHRESLKRVNEMIELTGLTAEKHKQIGMLSKGYRQRVGIAQALIHNPRVLILDEPTSGLDPNQIIEIRNLIKQIAADKCVILSTHIMQEVEAICTRIVLVNKGRIVADGAPHQVGKQSITIVVEFNKPVTESFFDMQGIISLKKHSELQWLVECLADNDIRETIFHKAVANQVGIVSLQRNEKPLEVVFRELTQ